MQGKDIPKLIAYIEAQGSLLRMKLKGQRSRTNGGGGKRGIIRAFSRNSRLRLMRFMARLKTRKIRATFITLTFKGYPSNESAKRAFKRFTMRARRSFPSASGVWRMEFQERGAIHFHLLMFNLPFWKQAELQSVWEACTNEVRSIVDIRLVHGARSIMAYISKYIAKPDERTEITSLEDDTYQHGEREKLSGRFWGWINKKLLPLGEVVAGVLTDRQTIKSISSFAWALLKSDNPYNSLSFHLFCDNARWLCERAIEEGGCLMDEWSFTVRDNSEARASHSPYTEHFSEPELSIKEPLSLAKQSRPRSARSVQPCTAEWTKRAILDFPALMISDFANDGIIATIS